MPARRTNRAIPPALAAQLARDPIAILSSSKSRGAARRALVILLLIADGNGVATSYSVTIADAADMAHGTAVKALKRLRELGEISTERQPVSHRPGMWKITALR